MLRVAYLLTLLFGSSDFINASNFFGSLIHFSDLVPNLWCNFKPSLKLIDVFNELDGLRKLVSFQQNKFHIEIPLYLETELTGIISEWARGKKWKDLVFNTSLDEGDVVRIIRRSIDVLSQVHSENPYRKKEGTPGGYAHS